MQGARLTCITSLGAVGWHTSKRAGFTLTFTRGGQGTLRIIKNDIQWLQLSRYVGYTNTVHCCNLVLLIGRLIFFFVNC